MNKATLNRVKRLGGIASWIRGLPDRGAQADKGEVCEALVDLHRACVRKICELNPKRPSAEVLEVIRRNGRG